MTSLRVAGLATLMTLGGLLGATGPALADEATPAPIVAWFAGQAPSVAGDVLAGAAVDSEEEITTPATGYTAGNPIRLYDWNPEFVSGASTDVAVTTDVWVAGLLHEGTVVGTIAATLTSTGEVAFDRLDNDVEAGTALISGTIAGEVVHDSQLGGLIEVGTTIPAAETVTGLSTTAATAAASVQSVDDLRVVVNNAADVEEWDGALDDGSETDGGVTGVINADMTGDDQGSPVAGPVVLVLAVLVGWFVVRRSGGRRV
ncbi:MAG TPA: hypothetical protein VN408_18490 [Actinoplanes sp.]|nr:hypothetical protein [Actinoplanes sp.]